MRFAYWYDYPIEIFMARTVEGQVNRGDERYLFCLIKRQLFIFVM